MWQHFDGLRIRAEQPSRPRRKYSVTDDVLSFQTCSKQYGMFKGRKYEPATVPQLFWGIAIHEVLDKAHEHYKGRIEGIDPGTIPTDEDIERYFREVENTLRARDIYAMNNVSEMALLVLQRFNRIEGPSLYPLVLETECKLEADRDSYVLEGRVDVLRHADGGGVEIWDYKGVSRPGMAEIEFQRYLYQTHVYAELYRRRTGTAPRRVVLYFLNELAGDREPEGRPTNAILEVDVNNYDIDEAMRSFDTTVAEIEACRDTGHWPDPRQAPNSKTCKGCDLRWDCAMARQAHGAQFRMTYP